MTLFLKRRHLEATFYNTKMESAGNQAENSLHNNFILDITI